MTKLDTLDRSEANGAAGKPAMTGGSDTAPADASMPLVYGAPAPAPPADPGATLWQEQLLPFMTVMLAGMAIFFFLASLGQLVYLHRTMFEGTALLNAVPTEELVLAEDAVFEDQLANRRWQTLAALELYGLQRRYHQANVLLMARTWVRYLGFVTGMILALVGATFILGKLREPESKVEASSKGGSFLVQGESPGIILAALGVILMLATILVYQQISVQDMPLFTPLYDDMILVRPVQGEAAAEEASGLKPDLALPEGANLESFGTDAPVAMDTDSTETEHQQTDQGGESEAAPAE